MSVNRIGFKAEWPFQLRPGQPVTLGKPINFSEPVSSSYLLPRFVRRIILGRVGGIKNITYLVQCETHCQHVLNGCFLYSY